MLAGVPKAPSRNNPLSNPEKGKVRRDWILGRMANLGMIDERQRLIAQNTPATAAFYGQVVEVDVVLVFLEIYIKNLFQIIKERKKQ